MRSEFPLLCERNRYWSTSCSKLVLIYFFFQYSAVMSSFHVRIMRCDYPRRRACGSWSCTLGKASCTAPHWTSIWIHMPDWPQPLASRFSEEMNIPTFEPKEVIAKFKNLRRSYCQQLKKIEDSRRTAQTEGEVYVPRVFWFDLMHSFIRPFVHQRPLPSSESNAVS